VWVAESSAKIRVVRKEANRVFYVYISSGYQSSMDLNTFLGYFEKVGE
jgi:hypothetical protein